MSKKGGGSRPVYDYHLSIDYAVCAGPVDHFNKVWVKDKSVLCGVYYTRQDVEVNQPELFGGDDSEGGVTGTLEIYPGSDSQISSWELSQRAGLLPETMPGYRGIAHLFFRGLRDWDAIDSEQSISAWGGILGYVIRALIPGLNRASTRNGWKWTSNNPYLPPTKVSATRLPKDGLLDPYAAIWPPAGIDANGNLYGLARIDQTPVAEDEVAPDTPEGGMNVLALSIEPNGMGGVIDLHELGYTQTQIDNGEVQIDANWQLLLMSHEDHATTDSTLTTEVKFHSALPMAWSAPVIAPVSGEEALVSVTDLKKPAPGQRDYDIIISSQITATQNLGPVTAPVGCRFVQVRAGFVLGAGTVTPYLGTPTHVHDEVLYDNPNAGYWSGIYGKGDIEVTHTATPPGEEPDPSTEVAPPNDTSRDLLRGFLDVKTAVPTKMGLLLDLHAMGFTQAEIDLEKLKIGSVFAAHSRTTIGALPSTNTQYGSSITFYSVEPGFWYSADGRIDPIPEENDNRNNLNYSELDAVHMTIDLTIPAGTRWIQLRNDYTTAVGRVTTVDTKDWNISTLSYGVQHCGTDDTLGPLPDANPARMIYECMTNDEWGKGEPISLMNTASFDAAAETLWNERFGMSLAYFQQGSIEAYVQEILDHIQALLFQDPSTGLWTLTLLRGGYDVASLPVLDESNCVTKNRKRRLWGETINEIVVSYTDPNTEKSATVSAHDMGNIAIQGGVISETRDYHGIRNPHLAQYVANRDVRAASYPLFSCQVVVDRREWAAKPGDVRKLSVAADGITEIVVRVMKADYGDPSDRKIVLDVTEDIFAIERATYGSPQGSEWSNAVQAPTAPDAQFVFTAPLPSLVRAGGDISDIDANYPAVAVGLLADDNSHRPAAIDVHAPVTAPNGDTSVQKIGEIDVTNSGLLSSALPVEAESRLPRSLIEGVTRSGAAAGDFFLLGWTEAFSEIVMLDSYDADTGEWVIARGMWDTVPIYWPVGSRIWAYTFGPGNADPYERAAGEAVTYNLLPRTGLGVLDFDDSNPVTATFTDRPFAPFRPGNCELDGQGFGSVVDHEAPFPTEITATWNTRNRTTEDQVAVRWTEGNVAVEAGQTTVLRILDDLGQLHAEITGLTGTSETILASQLPPSLEGYIEFLSERDGYRSVFGARRYFDIRPPVGYGLAYGLGYGGNY